MFMPTASFCLMSALIELLASLGSSRSKCDACFIDGFVTRNCSTARAASADEVEALRSGPIPRHMCQSFKRTAYAVRPGR